MPRSDGIGRGGGKMLPRFVVTLVIFFAASCSLFGDCSCHKVDKGETTHWGGNEIVVLDLEKPYRELRGVVSRLNGEAAGGVLIEVFTNPDYLLRIGPQTPEEKAKQRRLKACRVGTNGKFCIHLKPGRYEVRASMDAGWDVTKAYVIIDPRDGQTDDIKIELQIGT
jgi:hypothetical protein